MGLSSDGHFTATIQRHHFNSQVKSVD
uniref:Uncharacterized protein n=1 Tax=Anguilla anguilla TaxID=7936 RepID=A0A0E9SEI0_ANGAN